KRKRSSGDGCRTYGRSWVHGYSNYRKRDDSFSNTWRLVEPSNVSTTCASDDKRRDNSWCYCFNSTTFIDTRSEEHTSELQSRFDLVCRLLLEKKKSFTSDH